MLSWHASVDDMAPTFPHPVQLLDLAFLGSPLQPDVQADLGDCLRAQLQAAENLLRPGQGQAMLVPSGVTMDATGVLSTAADYEVDYAYDDEAVITALNNMSGEIRRQAEKLRCFALGYYVRMRPEGGPQEVSLRRSTEWQQKDRTPPHGTLDAVAVDLEHRAGVAITVFMPYGWQESALFVGRPLAIPSRRRIWA
ncbi:hypothetical protein ABT294_48085 [Nonomuraea sp. NPDC000554]|uniref:hypothetical protein n=1 Tax=Nonomuraea sp. NPDC000554 TaxID=3154259 RepID=UPI00331DFA1B